MQDHPDPPGSVGEPDDRSAAPRRSPRTVTAEIRPDGVVVLDGRDLSPTAGTDARTLLMTTIGDMAVIAEEPLRVQVRYPGGTRDLLARPDGEVISVATSPDPGTTPTIGVEPPVRPTADPSGTRPPAGPAGEPAPTTRTDPPHVRLVRLTTGSTAVLPVSAGPSVTPALTPTAPVVVTPPPRDGLIVPPPRRPGLPKDTLRPAMAGIGLVILALVGGAALVTGTGRTTRTATADPRPATVTRTATGGVSTPAPRIELTAVVPGYATVPRWTLPVAADTNISIGGDGTVLARTPTGALVRLDPATGRTTWSATTVGEDGCAGPIASTIDGRSVAALACTGRLVYWPLPTTSSPATPSPASSAGPAVSTTSAGSTVPAGTAGGGPRTVALPGDAGLVWTGGSPLIVTPGAGYAVIRAGVLTRVGVPAGYAAVSADPAGVVAVAAATGRWVRIAPDTTGTTGATTSTVHVIPAPPGTTTGPARIVPVGARYLLALWTRRPDDDQPLSLVDTMTGQTDVAVAAPAVIDSAAGPVVRAASGTATAVGDLVIDPDDKRVEFLVRTYQVLAVTPDHIYAGLAGRTFDIRPVGLTAYRTLPVDPAADIPIAITGRGSSHEAALVVHTTPTGRYLLSLPHL